MDLSYSQLSDLQTLDPDSSRWSLMCDDEALPFDTAVVYVTAPGISPTRLNLRKCIETMRKVDYSGLRSGGPMDTMCASFGKAMRNNTENYQGMTLEEFTAKIAMPLTSVAGSCILPGVMSMRLKSALLSGQLC